MDDETIKRLTDTAPKYNVKATRKTVQKVTRYLIEDCQLGNETNAGAILDKLTKSLCFLLRRYIIKYDKYITLDASEKLDVRVNQVTAVGSISRLYAGAVLDKDTMISIAQKYVIWEDQLSKGIPFVPWYAKDDPTWAAVKIREVSRVVTRHGARYQLLFKAFNGRACGLEWTGVYSPSATRYIGGKIGFPRFSTTTTAPYDISGMWFTTLLYPVNGMLTLEVFATSSSMRDINRTLYKERQGKCLLKLAETCFNCPVGRDKCRLGRRLETYTEKAQCLNYKHSEEGEEMYHSGFIEDTNNTVCYDCFMEGKFNREVRGLT